MRAFHVFQAEMSAYRMTPTSHGNSLVLNADVQDISEIK